MLRFLLSCLFALAAASAFGAEPSQGQGTACSVPKIEMRLVAAPQGTMAEVLADQRLVNPKIEYHCGQWTECFEPATENGRLLYRAKSYFSPTPNTLFTVTSQAPRPTVEFRAAFAFRQCGKEPADPVILDSAKPNALVAVCCDPAGPDVVLRVINRYRSQYRLPPVCYDPAYAAISQTNNAMGGVHRYTGNGRQTWAGTSDPESAVAMWMNSSGHRNIIMAGNLSRGGSNCASNGATFTGNPW